MSKFTTLLEAVIHQKPLDIQEAVNEILREKITTLIEAKRKEVADNMFVNDPEDEDEDDSFDEISEQRFGNFEEALNVGDQYWIKGKKALHTYKGKTSDGHHEFSQGQGRNSYPTTIKHDEVKDKVIPFNKG